MSRYVQEPQFTQLFRHRHRNYDAICLGLHELARETAGSMQWRRNQDPDDARQIATMVAIKSVEKFDPQLGSTAFSYFTKLIFRELFREQKRQAMRFKRSKNILDHLKYQGKI